MSTQSRRWVFICFSLSLGFGALLCEAQAQQTGATAVRAAIQRMVQSIRAETDVGKQAVFAEQLFDFLSRNLDDVDAVAIDAIVVLLDNNTFEVQKIAVHMLEALGPKADRAMPALLRALENPYNANPPGTSPIVTSASIGDFICGALPRINAAVVAPQCKDGWYVRR